MARRGAKSPEEHTHGRCTHLDRVSKSCHHLATHREVWGDWKGMYQQEDRRVPCNPHLSLALPNVKGQT